VTYTIIGGLLVAAIVIGVILRKAAPKQHMPTMDDPGFEIARINSIASHKHRTEKIKQKLKNKNPEDSLANDLNDRGGPL
jgi:hypothetical protein